MSTSRESWKGPVGNTPRHDCSRICTSEIDQRVLTLCLWGYQEPQLFIRYLCKHTDPMVWTPVADTKWRVVNI